MNRLERNRILEKWIPWIQKRAAVNFAKYDHGTCDMDDVFQVGCISAMRGIDEDDGYEPFYFLRVNRDMGDHLRKSIKRKDRHNIPYDDSRNGKCRKLCGEIDIKSAIGKLDADERAVIILSYWKGMSSREVSKTTGMSQRTVVRRMDRALEELHEILS